ncbi:MAG: TerB N-terminal domain-containing protein [Oscillospiraceae bacterium]|jgi:hypothetical protein|nr:TerB N-terminal domain-containing protein [Oscillospiraceae bacterium]
MPTPQDIISWLRDQFQFALADYVLPAENEMNEEGPSRTVIRPAAALISDNLQGLERIRAMRRLQAGAQFKSVSGSGRAERFCTQIDYMKNYCPKGLDPRFRPSIPDTGKSITYADLTDTNLEYYFRWRMDWQQHAMLYNDPLPFFFLYCFELLNGFHAASPTETIQLLADFWHKSALMPFHKYKADFCVWLKDFYITHDIPVPFAELVQQHHLEDLFPNEIRRPEEELGYEQKMLAASDYDYKRKSYYTGRADRILTLEWAFRIALGSLRVLVKSYGEELDQHLIKPPGVFYFYRPFYEVPVILPLENTRTQVYITQDEIYRFRAGQWNCTRNMMERDSSSPGVGYITYLLDQAIREIETGNAAKPDGAESFLSRWTRSLAYHNGINRAVYNPRFSAIIKEAAQMAIEAESEPPPDCLTPTAAALEKSLSEEPWRTITEARLLRGGTSRSELTKLFLEQGRLLRRVTADKALNHEQIAASVHTPCYTGMEADGLYDYIAWRTGYESGKSEGYQNKEMEFVRLYCAELLSGISGKDTFADLCRLLVYTSRDRKLVKFFPDVLRLWYLHMPKKEKSFTELLIANQVCIYFPELFLLDGSCPQLLDVYNQVSCYKIMRSAFYKPVKHDALQACLSEVLDAVQAYFATKKKMLGNALLQPKELYGSAATLSPISGWFVHLPKLPKTCTHVQLSPLESYTRKRNGTVWFIENQPEVFPYANVVCGCILKRMEVALRRRLSNDNRLSSDCASFISRINPYRAGSLENLLQKPAFGETIDAAVDAYLDKHGAGKLLDPPKTKKSKTSKKPSAEPDLPAHKPVVVDFSLLDTIRAESEETLGKLMLAEEGAPTGHSAPQGAGGAPTGHSAPQGAASLRAALTEEQIAALDSLAEEGSAGYARHDELFWEEINALALEYIGDTLVDSGGIYEDYLDNWIAAGQQA